LKAPGSAIDLDLPGPAPAVVGEDVPTPKVHKADVKPAPHFFFFVPFLSLSKWWAFTHALPFLAYRYFCCLRLLAGIYATSMPNRKINETAMAMMMSANSFTSSLVIANLLPGFSFSGYASSFHQEL
jgi:hypothetical protein